MRIQFSRKEVIICDTCGVDCTYNCRAVTVAFNYNGEDECYGGGPESESMLDKLWRMLAKDWVEFFSPKDIFVDYLSQSVVHQCQDCAGNDNYFTDFLFGVREQRSSYLLKNYKDLPELKDREKEKEIIEKKKKIVKELSKSGKKDENEVVKLIEEYLDLDL